MKIEAFYSSIDNETDISIQWKPNFLIQNYMNSSMLQNIIQFLSYLQTELAYQTVWFLLIVEIVSAWILIPYF